MVCEDSKTAEAKSAGADIVGGDDFIDKIKAGEIIARIGSEESDPTIRSASRLLAYQKKVLK